jgi:hypothetical protein
MFVNFILLLFLIFYLLILLYLFFIFLKSFIPREVFIFVLFFIWIFILIKLSIDNLFSLNNVHEKKKILCEEKKILSYYTYHKFGFLKYLLAHQNEIGGVLFNTVNKMPSQILIPTGNMNVWKGPDSILYNSITNDWIGIQYKNKTHDYSIMSDKEFHSMMKNLLKEIKHCDKLIIDTRESNVLLLHDKFNSSYSKFKPLILENKIVIFDSDKWLSGQDPKLVAKAINDNRISFEKLIIEKNKNAGRIISELNEAAASSDQFNELGDLHQNQLKKMLSTATNKELEYVKLHLHGRKIINETVANDILKTKK